MESTESESHFSIGEVEALLTSISHAEYKQMILLIEQLNPHRAGCTGEDIYELALRKILVGDRKWPRHVKRQAFIRNVVRSLIWSEVKKNQDALSQASGTDHIDDISDLALTADLQNDEKLISKAVHALMDAFDGDKDVCCILFNKIKSLQATKIKEICKLTEQSYQAAMRRLKRNARKLFPGGIDYWRDDL